MHVKEIIVEILLVEDNPRDAELAARALKKIEQVPYVLTRFIDGKSALDFLADADNLKLAQIILLDLKLPKISGYDVLCKLKADSATRHIPIIVLVSCKTDPAIKKCISSGADGYIVKPVSHESFINSMAKTNLGYLVAKG